MILRGEFHLNRGSLTVAVFRFALALVYVTTASIAVVAQDDSTAVGPEPSAAPAVQEPNDAPAQAAQDETNSTQSAQPILWKLQTGQLYLVSASQLVKETVPIGGQSVELPMTLLVDAKWEVTSVDEAGVATIKPTINRLKFEAKNPFLGEIKVDTQAAPSAAGMTDLEQTLRASVGLSWEFKLSPTGQISDVQLPAEAPARGDELSLSLAAPAQLQSVMTPLLVLPPQSPKPGESWTVADALPVPVADQAPLGIVISYVGPADAGGQSLEKFELRGETSAEAAAEEDATGAGVAASFTLRETKVTGFGFFDPQAGYVTSVTLRSTLSIAAEVEGMVTDSKVAVDSNITIKRESP